MTEFSMDGKEIVALTDEHLKQLRDAGYSEIEGVPDRGNIVDGKWKSLPLGSREWWMEATHEVRVFRKLLDTGYKGKVSFVNKTNLEEIVYVVAKIEPRLSGWNISPVEWDEKKMHGKGVFVEIVARIRKNATREVREKEGYLAFHEGDNLPYEFIWTDGNYCCDCNRELFFERAKGNEDFDQEQCSEGRFSVNLVNPKTGEVFYREFE